MKYYVIMGCVLWLCVSCGRNSKKRAWVEEAPLISTTYTDDLDRTIVLRTVPERVVSIAPNITEIIFALGAEERLIARSQACDYPLAAKEIPQITTYPQLDLEYLSGLDADLVFSTDEIFTGDDIALLEEVRIPVYIQSYRNLDEVYEGIRELGEILERDSAAYRLADSLERVEEIIVSRTENLPRYRTMILISADPLKVVGGKGFLNEFITKAGGENIFEDKEQAYPTTTLEEIMYRNPEFIIFPADNPATLQAILSQYPALTRTSAYASRQVFTISPDWMYRPGPRMIRGLLELTHILHASLTPDNILQHE